MAASTDQDASLEHASKPPTTTAGPSDSPASAPPTAPSAASGLPPPSAASAQSSGLPRSKASAPPTYGDSFCDWLDRSAPASFATGLAGKFGVASLIEHTVSDAGRQAGWLMGAAKFAAPLVTASLNGGLKWAATSIFGTSRAPPPPPAPSTRAGSDSDSGSGSGSEKELDETCQASYTAPKPEPTWQEKMAFVPQAVKLASYWPSQWLANRAIDYAGTASGWKLDGPRGWIARATATEQVASVFDIGAQRVLSRWELDDASMAKAQKVKEEAKEEAIAQKRRELMFDGLSAHEILTTLSG